MSSLKLLHSGGNGVIIAAPSSNPAANRTITLNDTYAGDGSFVTANSSGNVGLGTASPSFKLTVSSDENNLFLKQNSGDHGYILDVNQGDGSLAFNRRSSGSDTERMRIDASGKVGIGTTPDTILHVKANFGDMLRLDRDNAGAVGNQLAFRHKDGSGNFVETGTVNCVSTSNADSGQLSFSTKASGGSNTERMRIDSSGRTFVGTTNTAPHTDGTGIVIHPTAGVLVGVKSTHAAIFARHDSNGECVRFQRANTDVGSVDVTTSGTSYNTSSDYRLKENVVAISDGITRLKTLKPSRFNFKIDKDTTVDGFIAHEVTPVVPEAITGTKDEVDSDNNPIYQGIDQSKLVPLLTAALQEEIAKREALEARVAALEGA